MTCALIRELNLNVKKRNLLDPANLVGEMLFINNKACIIIKTEVTGISGPLFVSLVYLGVICI